MFSKEKSVMLLLLLVVLSLLISIKIEEKNNRNIPVALYAACMIDIVLLVVFGIVIL